MAEPAQQRVADRAADEGELESGVAAGNIYGDFLTPSSTDLLRP
jgi:hypothetical protein